MEAGGAVFRQDRQSDPAARRHGGAGGRAGTSRWERGERLTWTPPEALTAARLSDLCRLVVERAGIPNSGQPTADRFIVRSGPEPPELLAKLLQEGLDEGAPEIPTLLEEEALDVAALAPGGVAVQQGYSVPGPIPLDLWLSVRGGRVLLFAVERRDPAGKILSVLWAALSDEPPDQEAPLKAVVAWQILGGGVAGKASGGA
jgi:hypothetical protein